MKAKTKILVILCVCVYTYTRSVLRHTPSVHHTHLTVEVFQAVEIKTLRHYTEM